MAASQPRRPSSVRQVIYGSSDHRVRVAHTLIKASTFEILRSHALVSDPMVHQGLRLVNGTEPLGVCFYRKTGFAVPLKVLERGRYTIGVKASKFNETALPQRKI